MRLKVTVYLRPRTVAILLAKKGKRWGGQKWMAERLGVSQTYVSLMMMGKDGYPVPTTKQQVIWDLFRGMSHKPGGRLKDDDLFQYVAREPQGTEASI